MSRPRELSKIFSTATILATDEELSIIDLSGAINTASAAALAAANAYTDNATPDLTPAIQAASAAAVAYTDQELANIDLTNTIVTASTAAVNSASAYTNQQVSNINLTNTIITASAAAVSELNNRIVISSASPTTGNINGRLWVNPSTASAPVLQTYGSGEFRKTITNRTRATGGSITQVGNYTVHTFTSTSNFIALEPLTVDYLVVAGGGGGGSDADVGGGGGGGGFRTGSLTITAESHPITIGNGGARGTGPDITGTGGGTNGTQGGSSSFNIITSTGGGYGGTRSQAGGSGGSGGGGGDAGMAGGAGIAGQGNNGGNGPGMNTQSGNDSGGGGGAGSAAANNIPGVGLANSLSGTSVTYAKGGRGAQITAAVAGDPNTGDGGSGVRNGGSGIVIIRYLT
jgi:hypothetical protein